jgi:hypothetical protein
MGSSSSVKTERDLRLEEVGQGSSPCGYVFGGGVLLLVLFSQTFVGIGCERKERLPVSGKNHHWELFVFTFLEHGLDAFVNIVCGMLLPSI